MVIDDEIWNKYLKKIITVGLISLENSRLYYDTVNDRKTADFINDHDAAPHHFKFLVEVLTEPELTKCPVCGHYNDNIECPIIKCEYCSHEFRITTPTSAAVCHDCIASKTGNCTKIPSNPGNI